MRCMRDIEAPPSLRGEGRDEGRSEGSQGTSGEVRGMGAWGKTLIMARSDLIRVSLALQILDVELVQLRLQD